MSDKRFKSAYFMRKQEKEDLKQEVRRLQAELVKLNPARSLEQVAAENVALSAVLQEQQLGVARVQSNIPSVLETHPLYTRILLKKSWDDRSKTLLGLRDEKLQAAYEYVAMRSQLSSWDQPHLSDERFETANGDVCSAVFQTVHLPGVRSVKQAFDALLFSLNNAEITISERLGHVTVRDDYGGVDGKTLNARIVSTNDDGVATEINCAMMAQLLDTTADVCGGKPCGIAVINSIDGDELYPYAPSERVRKDVVAAFVLTQNNPDGESDDVVVTLRRAAFSKLHCPEFAISEAAWMELQQDVAQWGDVTTRAIRSELYSVP